MAEIYKSDLLPDLGAYASSHNMMEMRLIGALYIQAVSQLDKGIYSATGSTRVFDSDYCVSLDFSEDSWRQFCHFSKIKFGLDLTIPSMVNLNQALGFDPPLPMRIDLTVTPGEATSSQETGEEFTPLLVEKVHSTSLLPDHQAIERRHEWWLNTSEQYVNVCGPKGLLLREYFKPWMTDVNTLKTEQFQRSLLVCYLIRTISEGSDAAEVLDYMLQQNWISKSSVNDAIIRSNEIMTFLSDSQKDPGLHTIEKSHIRLMLWYLALRIYSGIGAEFIKDELLSVWKSGEGSADYILSEARYVLLRKDRLAIKQDSVEEDIAELISGDPFQEIISGRLNAYPMQVWEHPELSKILKEYVTYDLLCKLYESDHSGYVPQDLYHRSKINFDRICVWLKMFSEPELLLMVRTDSEL